MEKRNTLGETMQKIGSTGIGALAFLMMAGLTVCAFFFTSDMNQENAVHENITFLQDPVWRNLLVLAGCFLLFWFLRSRLERVPVKVLTSCLLVWTIAAGLLWVFSEMSYPTHDSRIVTQAGEAAARGDYSNLADPYFQRFPYQLGYVLYSEFWMRLVPVKGGYLHIEVMNVVCLALVYLALVRLTQRLFEDERLTRVTILLLALCAQPLLFSTFLYGILPGLCCAMWAVAFTVDYIKTGNWRRVPAAAVLIACAVLLKQNYLIVLVAVCLILLLHFFRRPRLLHLGFLAFAVVLTLSFSALVQAQYEKRSGVDFGDGIPIVSWAAMGLNEGYTTSGWYNVTYTERNFEQHQEDADLAATASLAEIRARLAFFRAHPQSAAEFFGKKIASQWNEPTYQSIWTNQVRGHYIGGPWGVARFFTGAGERFLKGYMGFYQQLIFCCAAVALFRWCRSRRLTPMLLPLIVLGGFLYHTIFEGKSQYIEPYFIMLVPIAAYGLYQILNQMDRLVQKRKKTVTISTDTRQKEAASIH